MAWDISSRGGGSSESESDHSISVFVSLFFGKKLTSGLRFIGRKIYQITSKIKIKMFFLFLKNHCSAGTQSRWNAVEMNGFGFFECCDCRDGKSFVKEHRGNDTANLLRESPRDPGICGVGINFRADKSGALLVSSLIPGGENIIKTALCELKSGRY